MDMFKRFMHNKMFIISVILLCPLLVVALFGPCILPYDPLEINYNEVLRGSSAQHLLGTDEFGRDILSRLIIGIRPTLIIAFSSAMFALLLGLILGIVAGYAGGWCEQVIMRLMDIVLCFPPILLALMVVGFWGSGIRNLIIIITVIYTPHFCRIAYSSTLQVKKLEFVESEISLGASHPRVMWNSILPNIMPPMIIQASLTIAAAILLESGLSFLGLGVVPPTPSWGQMVGVAKGYIHNSLMYVFWPSLCLVITILAVNLLGDSLRDILDPKLNKDA